MSADNGIEKIIGGVMMVVGPKVMSGMMETMTPVSNNDRLGGVMHSAGLSLMAYLSYIFLVIGGFMILFGLIELFVGDNEKTKNKPQLPSLDIKVEKIEDKHSELLKKEEKKENPAHLISTLKPQNMYDLDDEELNIKMGRILNKIDKLMSLDAINTHIENKLLLENTKQKYLPNLVNHYIEIPLELRKKEAKNTVSAHHLTNQQLDIIQHGLNDLELLLLEDKQYEMKVMKRFLESKFESNKEFEMEAS